MKSVSRTIKTLLACLTVWLCGCTPTGPANVNTPQGNVNAYPPTIDGETRRAAAESAWRSFLAEHRLPAAPPDWEAPLYVPRALPLELAGRIELNPGGGALGETEAKEVLRRFIERALPLLGGGGANAVGVKDLSLTAFSVDGNFYRATYRQMSYPLPLAGGYGELRLTMSKAGLLLQWGSRLVPKLDVPTRAQVAVQAIADKLVGREFKYANLAGQATTYRVARRAEVGVSELVIYPRAEGGRLAFHLAYKIEVGSGTTWTVYCDAVNGRELDVKPNFVS